MTGPRTIAGLEVEISVSGGTSSHPGDKWISTLDDRALNRSYRLAAFILGNTRDAEDATHDALERAWVKRSSLRELETAQSWFDKILINVCRDRLRRHRYTLPLSSPVGDTIAEQRDPIQEALSKDEILRALDKLGFDQRVVIVLRFMADLTIEAISDRLGVPAGTVKSRIHCALATMREELT